MAYEVPVEYRRIGKIAARLIVLVIALAIAAAALASSVATVEFGYVGIMMDPTTGSVWSVGEGPKLVLKLPWQRLELIYAGQESLDMWTSDGMTGEYPAIRAFTSDGLEARVDITIQYHVDPAYALEVFKKYPRKDWEDRTLAPILRQIVRDIIAGYRGTDTIPMREEIARLIEERFREALEELGVRGIVIDSVNLRNIDLPENFKKALEDKLAAEQRKIQAEYERERIITLANASATEAILKAQGEAEAELLRAKAEAEALVVRANATKRQIELIAEAFGDPRYALEYFRYYYLAEMAKGRAVVIAGGEVVPMVNVPTGE